MRCLCYSAVILASEWSEHQGGDGEHFSWVVLLKRAAEAQMCLGKAVGAGCSPAGSAVLSWAVCSCIAWSVALGRSPKASQREAGLVGGKVSVVLTGTLMKCLQLPKSEKGSSFSIAFYLVGFGLFPQRLLLHAKVEESYLASCRSRCSHLICWKPKGVSVYIS